MSAPLLEIVHLAKIFRSYWLFRPIPAVRDVTLSIYPGEAFGFLGHNGAGKTTTIKCIIGLLRKNSGQIFYQEEKLCHSSQYSAFGYLPEQPYFYDHLTVQETLELFAALHGIRGAYRQSRITEVLRLVGLEEKQRTRVCTLSKGMQQRVGLAQAIINKPRLLILDEPFSGLDPLGRLEIRKLILNLKEQGTTIFMSSHILSDVEDICDRVAILVHGSVRTVFALADAPKLFGEAFELSISGAESQPIILNSLLSLADGHSIVGGQLGNILLMRFNEEDIAQKALAVAASAGIRVISFKPVSLRLEDIFLKMTGDANGPGAGTNLQNIKTECRAEPL